MIGQLKRIKAKRNESTYSLALDIGVSYFVLYKYLNKMKVTDRMKDKIEDYVRENG